MCLGEVSLDAARTVTVVRVAGQTRARVRDLHSGQRSCPRRGTGVVDQVP